MTENMVRNYQRKKEKTYTIEQLRQAIEDVTSKKMTSYKAAEVYGIPRSTIITRLYRPNELNDKPGRPIALGENVERNIADNLLVMEKHGYPLTREEIAAVISKYVRNNGIVTPFKNHIPGRDWLKAFLERNNLLVKTAQAIEMERKKDFDPFTVYEYFDSNTHGQLSENDVLSNVSNERKSPILSIVEERSSRVTTTLQELKEGQFVLTKFQSSKGKTPFQYVCRIEDISNGRIVVQSLKSHRNNKKGFRVTENDIKIIEKHDILCILPDPKETVVEYTFENEIDIKELKK